METNSSKATARCSRCGEYYDKVKGNFPPVSADIYKINGHLPVCNRCVDQIYKKYYAECGDQEHAVRQFCRKFDLCWSPDVYKRAEKVPMDKSMIVKYLGKLKTSSAALKTYDDTLMDEGTLWSFIQLEPYVEPEVETPIEVEEPASPAIDVPEEWIDAWGEGLDIKDYEWLEKRYYHYWNQMSDVDKHDIGNEPLIRQICNLEFEIRASKGTGKTIEKNVNTLNSLVKSMNWTPTQSKTDDISAYDKTPFGVWIKRFEDARPIPEPDDDLKDPDHLKHFIHVYFLGHLCHMMGIKNEYNRLYEEEMEKYSVAPPKYEDDETNELYAEIFGESE